MPELPQIAVIACGGFLKTKRVMKEFFKEMLIEPFEDGEYFIGIMAWTISLIVFGLIAWLFGWLIDSSYLPIKEKDGVIVDKYIRPAHYTTTYINSGKVLVPINTFHRESYHIEVEIDDMRDDVSIYLNDFSKKEIGDKIHCEYTNCRLFKTMYIQSYE